MRRMARAATISGLPPRGVARCPQGRPVRAQYVSGTWRRRVRDEQGELGRDRLTPQGSHAHPNAACGASPTRGQPRRTQQGDIMPSSWIGEAAFGARGPPEPAAAATKNGTRGTRIVQYGRPHRNRSAEDTREGGRPQAVPRARATTPAANIVPSPDPDRWTRPPTKGGRRRTASGRAATRQVARWRHPAREEARIGWS